MSKMRNKNTILTHVLLLRSFKFVLKESHISGLWEPYEGENLETFRRALGHEEVVSKV